MYDKYDLDRMLESDSDYWRSTASEELKRYNEREAESSKNEARVQKRIDDWEKTAARNARIAQAEWEKQKREREKREKNSKEVNRSREIYDRRLVYDDEKGVYYTIRHLEKDYPRIRTVAKALGWTDGNTLLDKEDFERDYNAYVKKFDAFRDWTKNIKEFEEAPYLSYVNKIANIKGQKVSSHVAYLLECLDDKIRNDVNDIIDEINLEMNVQYINEIINRVRKGEIFVRLVFPRVIIDLEPDFDGDYHYDEYVGDLYTILAKIFKTKTMHNDYLEYYSTAVTKENIFLDNHGEYRTLVNWFDLQRKGISGD